MSSKLTLTVICMSSMLSATVVHAYEVDRRHSKVVLASVDELERCHEDFPHSDICLDALKRYVKANPKAAFSAGKLARARFNSWVALQFLVPALTPATAEAACDDEDLRLAVLSGLALPTDDPNQVLATKAATGVCAAKLQPHIRGGFGDANAYYRTNACAVLKKQNAAPLVCGPSERPPTDAPKRTEPTK